MTKCDSCGNEVEARQAWLVIAPRAYEIPSGYFPKFYCSLKCLKEGVERL